MNDLTKLTLTAIISVVAKELLTWLAGRMKSKQIGSKIKISLAKLIRNNLLYVFADIILILVNSWGLYRSIIDTSPLTRGEVFIIALNVGLVLFWIRELFTDIRKYKIEPLEKRMQELLTEKKVYEVLSEVAGRLKVEQGSLPQGDENVLPSSGENKKVESTK